MKNADRIPIRIYFARRQDAAICGALMGAVYGLEAVPQRWVKKILNCRPHAGAPNVDKARPQTFWPVDALELAARLVGIEQ